MGAARSRLRRIVTVAASLFALWTVALIVAGFAAVGCQRRRVEGRIARSFEATAAFGDADLSLLRGTFHGTDLAIAKDVTAGTLRVKVKQLDAELAPLGIALVDSRLRELRLSGVELEASNLALLQTRSHGGKPFAVDALELRDVHLAAMPTMILPSFGRLEVHLERATAGPTVLRTALSWVFSLRSLVARVDLPGGVTIRLAYDHGRLRAQGGMFGSTPVEVPFAIPVLDPAHEMEQLAALGIELVQKMTMRQAEEWLDRGWDSLKQALPR